MDARVSHRVTEGADKMGGGSDVGLMHHQLDPERGRIVTFQSRGAQLSIPSNEIVCKMQAIPLHPQDAAMPAPPM